jgi:hypothetical protein
MGFLHLIQGSLMLYLGLTLNNIKDFRLPVNISFLSYNTTIQKLVLQTDQIAKLPIAAILSSFLFISAIAHFLIVINNKFYNRSLENNINYFRWFEYAFSSSIMIVLIAMFFGIYDLGAMILIFGLNATMNLWGLMMELYNQGREKVSFTPFWLGCFSGIIPWIVILIALIASNTQGNAPWFVYAALIVYFVFFNLFPINMYLQYKKIGKWQDYLYGERMYIILSLVAKSALVWIVFFGTLQPA